MATSARGYINKTERLKAAEKKITQPAGEYLDTIFFSKGLHRGRLAVWENRVEWEVFRDPQYQQHLDWNHPDCRCLDHLTSPIPILTVLSALAEYGWKYNEEE